MYWVIFLMKHGVEYILFHYTQGLHHASSIDMTKYNFTYCCNIYVTTFCHYGLSLTLTLTKYWKMMTEKIILTRYNSLLKLLDNCSVPTSPTHYIFTTRKQLNSNTVQNYGRVTTVTKTVDYDVWC